MAYAEIQNPKRRKRRRKNPTATKSATQIRKAVSNPSIRRKTTKAGALSFAKANGLKLVSKSAANPKRKRSKRRRNGLAVIPRRSNGILGNSKKDVKEVLSLLLGLFGTKGLGRFAVPFLAPYFAQMGVGKYTEIVVDGLIGLGLAPMIAKHFVGSQLAGLVRLGGGAAIGLDAMELIAPDTFNMLNPFNNNPIVISASGQVGIQPQAVAQIAQEVANSPNPQATANKLAGGMAALTNGQPIVYDNAVDMMPIGAGGVF